MPKWPRSASGIAIFYSSRAADRRQRETAHEILRDTEIYARARSSSFDQDPRKSPVPSPKGQDGPRTRRCNVISFRYPLSTDRTSTLGSSHLPSLSGAISIPYLALFRFSTARSYLMYDTPLRRRPNALVWYSALTTRHFRCGSGPILGPRVARVYVVRALSPNPAIRIRDAHKENSSVIVSRRQQKYGTAPLEYFYNIIKSLTLSLSLSLSLVCYRNILQ